jgi:hypothetical protein
MVTYETIDTWYRGNAFDCLLMCDIQVTCKGVRHELYTNRCALLSTGIASGMVDIPSTDVYFKLTTCPTAPTPAPTVYVERYDIGSFCNYTEYGGFEIINTVNTTIEGNVTECVELCDSVPTCKHITVDHRNASTCTVFGSNSVSQPVTHEASVLEKVIDGCFVPTLCEFGAADIGPAPDDSMVLSVDETLTAIQCFVQCSFNPSCLAFSNSSSACTLYNETLTSGPETTFYKNDTSCGVTVTTPPPTTGTPTSSPTQSPTDAPTGAPTTTPTPETQASDATCDYAPLPAFRPRFDGVVVHYVDTEVREEHNPCLLACDSNTLCVAMTHKRALNECTYYTAVGPIELDFVNSDNQTLFLKSGRCHKIHLSNETLCNYEATDEQFPSKATKPSVIGHLMTNVTELVVCAGKCDEDVTCQYFTYNEMSRECSFYDYVKEWGVSSFATTFAKVEEFCALESTFNNTRSPTSSPTDTPTSAPTEGDRGINLVLILIEGWCTSLTTTLIMVYILVCCGVCTFVCCTPVLEDEQMYQLYALVPDSIEYSIEF